MADVFVSYKAEDRARVRPMVDALQADGLSVWWDEQVGGGDAWRETIERELEAAGCVIVVWSKRSTGPDGRFVRDEANRAVRRGKYLPVTIDKVEPPLGFGETQALDLSRWKGDRSSPKYQAVSAAVHSLLDRAAPHRPSGATLPVSRRTILVGTGAAAAAAAAAGGFFLLKPSRARANSIAVLPFANLSGDPAQSYFSDGMAEELRTALAASGSLEVVARTSSEMLRNADAVTAARKLGVAHIVSGSVRRSPEMVRVNAQLIDGSDGIERWSQSFDRPFGDVLKIQSDIAQNVASALSVRLRGAAQSLRALGGTDDPRAQDLFLQALALRGQDDESAVRRRIELLDQAIAIDSGYALAVASKAQLLALWSANFAQNTASKNQYEARAIEAANHAIELAPDAPQGYSALANILRNRLEMRRALIEAQRAVSLAGGDWQGLNALAMISAQTGHAAEARALIDRSLRLDPLNPAAYQTLAWVSLFGRDYERSVAAAQRQLALAPDGSRAHALAGWGYYFLGRREEARKALALAPANDYRRMVGEAALAASDGRRDAALAKVEEIRANFHDAANYQYAQIYSVLRLADQAVAALDKARQARDPGMASLKVDPFFDPIRGDPRIAQMIARLFA